jgi:acetyl esterase/lipase
MPYDVANDPRIDPRLKALLSAMPPIPNTDVSGRQELLDEVNQPGNADFEAMYKMMMEACDTPEVVSSECLTVTQHDVVSQPDGNTIRINFIRPKSDEVVPCVYYIHGGGMASMSCFDGNYRAWGKIVANNNVAVAMVDFRNSVSASSVPEVEPFPAGLNDCVSGLKWVHEHAAELKIDASRVVVAGESGGGNLTLAAGMKLLKDGDIGLVTGLYALCPYIAGEWPQEHFPSSTQNNGIFLDLHHNRGKHGYGIEAFDAGNPLAWPSFASVDDVRGLPRVVVHVNECDPLRDEGLEFYRLCLAAGVPARARMSMGTMHGTEIFPLACPEISADTARDLAAFAKG